MNYIELEKLELFCLNLIDLINCSEIDKYKKYIFLGDYKSQIIKSSYNCFIHDQKILNNNNINNVILDKLIFNFHGDRNIFSQLIILSLIDTYNILKRELNFISDNLDIYCKQLLELEESDKVNFLKKMKILEYFDLHKNNFNLIIDFIVSINRKSTYIHNLNLTQLKQKIKNIDNKKKENFLFYCNIKDLFLFFLDKYITNYINKNIISELEKYNNLQSIIKTKYFDNSFNNLNLDDQYFLNKIRSIGNSKNKFEGLDLK